MNKKIKGPISILQSGTTSDHYLVWFDALLKTKPVQSEEVPYTSYRNFKKVDMENFKQDIVNSDLGMP